MHIRDWPAGERPREKLLQLGSGALSEAELLAIWLRHGTSGRNALDVARSLLTHFGSLRSVLTAERNALCGQQGVGPARWAELQAALEIVRRHHLERLQAGPVLGSPRAARDYLIARLRDLQHEVFCCLFLDSRHRLTSCEELFQGTIDGASVHPREVVKRALARNATAVILAHNHSSELKPLIQQPIAARTGRRYSHGYPIETRNGAVQVRSPLAWSQSILPGTA
ncbi:MAG TPA: DNA repair protein RadC [Steroidobacteraceae bacterium]|nr:DNA repair protein RadC [Steroidobacteraceae bacterium]